MNEQDLIKKAASGDAEAFGRLIEPYERPVYNFCRRVLGDGYDAEDVSQEVFIKIYRSIGGYTDRRAGSFKNWVYRIANNACIDELRKRKARPVAESLDETYESDEGESVRQFESPELPPEEAVLKKERQKIIADAIRNLAPEFKRVIILRDVRGFSYEDIAQMTGMKIGTVKSKISRARVNLKEQIQKKYV